MKKFLGILLVSLFYFSSAHSKEDPKFFSCENSFGIYKIYLKYHFTDLNKYDVVTNKFVKGSLPFITVLFNAVADVVSGKV